MIISIVSDELYMHVHVHVVMYVASSAPVAVR